MKSKVIFLGIALLAGVTAFAGNNKNSSGQQEKKKEKVEVYYFHFQARCVTCKTVESEAKNNVEKLFGKSVKFFGVNLDEPEGKAKGKELGISSQSLVVVKGDTKIDITNEGFMYARTKPEKFKQIMEEKIKPLL